MNSRASVQRSKSRALANLAAIAFVLALAVGCRTHGRVLRDSSPKLATSGPLRAAAVNPRYFSDAKGHIVYLTGSHTWNNFQDWGSSSPPPTFDYAGYLDFLQQHSLNFFRLWTWEQAADLPWSKDTIRFTPLPYLRTGPGEAMDGGPKFDLTRFNDAYFTRLHERVEQARDRGIYVSIMLFNGFSVADKSEHPTTGKGNPWRGHPYNQANNINGIDGDLNHDGQGWEIHTLQDPKVVALEKAYVKTVMDTVADLDNVLYEISNESDVQSRDWEYSMISFIHDYEKSHGTPHPVGMTIFYPKGNNADLWASPADWIAPNDANADPYKTNPPAADGRKVVVADTDHLWGIGGSADWAWKSFTRGLNTLFMDPYGAELVDNFAPLIADPRSTQYHEKPENLAEWELLRRNLGYTRIFANRMDLAEMTPQSGLASSTYCLADPGNEYLVYVPLPRRRYRVLRSSVTVNLSQAKEPLQAEWFDPESGEIFSASAVQRGASVHLTAPFRGAAVLHLSLRNRLGPE